MLPPKNYLKLLESYTTRIEYNEILGVVSKMVYDLGRSNMSVPHINVAILLILGKEKGLGLITSLRAKMQAYCNS